MKVTRDIQDGTGVGVHDCLSIHQGDVQIDDVCARLMVGSQAAVKLNGIPPKVNPALLMTMVLNRVPSAKLLSVITPVPVKRRSLPATGATSPTQLRGWPISHHRHHHPRST